MSSNRYEVVCKRWVRYQTDSNVKIPRNDRMYPSPGRELLYSYGSHFTLAQALRNRKGELTGFLLNADLYSVTTSRHQREIRWAVEQSPYPHVILPFEALRAAGIEGRNVEIIDVTADTWDERTVTEYELPHGAILEWVPRMGRREAFPGEDGDHMRYPSHDGFLWTEIGHRLACWTNGRKYDEYKMEYLPDGRTAYSYTYRRHFLGESLIKAKVLYRVNRQCKWCKATGLAEGPVNATWIPPKAEYLPVRFPLSSGRRYPWVQVATGRIEPGYWRSDRYSAPTCPDCHGQGRWTEPRYRPAYFLSGFDHNETRRSYFFCELPKGARPTTVAEAYDALKPDAVRLAEQMGREVRRQGDIFAIPVTSSRRELIKAGGKVGRMAPLLGTNHVATEVIEVDGVQYARGCLWHKPAGRDPDHARVRVGDQFHLIVKNTVPVAA